MTQRRRYRSVVADSARWDGFAFRADDIVISTPPKCGTTWMQRLVALLVFDGPELPAPIARVSPWLDMQLAPLDEVVARLEAQPHRRFLKTHTPLDGIPYDERVSYVVVGRDPRDVAVSSRHHMENMDIDRFMAAREAAVGLDDLAELSAGAPGPRAETTDEPAARLRAWIDEPTDEYPMSLRFVVRHLDQAWQLRDRPNVALFHYGDLLADLPGQLHRLARFVGYDADRDHVRELAASATFEAMRRDADRLAPNADIDLWHSNTEFFHRGTSGQWREHFGPDVLRHYEDRLRRLAPPELVAWLHHGWLGRPEQHGAAHPSGTPAPA